MKILLNLLLAATACAISTRSSATILVANNNTSNPGQYATLQSAIDAATDGDTIHIEPSNFIYDINDFYNGVIYLNKALTLIGIGHKPNKAIPYASVIPQIRMSGTACSIGATFIGLKMGGLRHACGQPAYNLHISHCDFTGLGGSYESNCFSPTGYYNTVVEGCIINNIGFNGVSVGNNALFQNNVFVDSHHFGNLSNVIVKNSLFITNTQGWTGAVVYGNAVTFENNIFYGLGPAIDNGSGLTNCVFNNNLTYQTFNDAMAGPGNTLSNNILSQDPLFVNYSSPVPTYNPIYNYRLQPLSPGHGAGTDGGDIGPYGGGFSFSETGEHPDLPVIRSMNIDNSTVPSQGSINVHVKVTVAKTDNP